MSPMTNGIPFVVVPAGTRNHFALDLGLDRKDVVGALEAFSHGVVRTVDLAKVNDRDLRQQCLPGPLRGDRRLGLVPGFQGSDRHPGSARPHGSGRAIGGPSAHRAGPSAANRG